MKKLIMIKIQRKTLITIIVNKVILALLMKLNILIDNIIYKMFPYINTDICRLYNNNKA